VTDEHAIALATAYWALRNLESIDDLPPALDAFLDEADDWMRSTEDALTQPQGTSQGKHLRLVRD
jgi:hypothetical protein